MSDADLASQPTLSRIENSATKKDLYRIGEYFVDQYIRKNKKEKRARLYLIWTAQMIQRMAISK